MALGCSQSAWPAATLPVYGVDGTNEGSKHPDSRSVVEWCFIFLMEVVVTKEASLTLKVGLRLLRWEQFPYL